MRVPKWLVFGFIALVVLGAIAAAGKKDDDTASAPPPAETTAPDPADPAATPKPAADPPPPPPPPPPPAAAKALRFSGSGGKTIAPFTLDEDSTLRWTATGNYFGIYDSPDNPSSENAGVPVNSQGTSGDTFLKSGRHEFQINAIGDWTIQISPGG